MGSPVFLLGLPLLLLSPLDLLVLKLFVSPVADECEGADDEEEGLL